MISTLSPTSELVPVGLGEMHASESGEIVAYSLGSCVAICLWDPLVSVAGMAHVVLPAAPAQGPGALPGKYADTALPALLELLQKLGALKTRLRCKIAGGAAVLALGGNRNAPSIGERNAEAVRRVLSEARLSISAQSTGGTVGRTVRIHVPSGRVTVRKVNGPEEDL